MANNLKDHLKEVADAIRAKKGTSDLINPQDFATEIEGISGGGSGGESGSNIEYFDLADIDALQDATLKGLMALGIMFARNEFAAGPAYYIQNAAGGGMTMVGIDVNVKIASAMGAQTVKETLEMSNLWEAYLVIPRITKEQFYDLNA